MNEWALKGICYGVMIGFTIITAVALVGSVAWILGFILELINGGDVDESESEDEGQD